MSSSRELSPSASGVLKPSEVLAKAADLIEPEGAWTRFAAAATAPLADESDDDNLEVEETSPDAKCWCASGSIWRVGRQSSPYNALPSAACHFFEVVVGGNIPDWNDAPDRTQAEVVAALRKASALAAEEGQ